MTVAALKRNYPLKWLEIDKDVPSGLFMMMGPEPARLLIGTSFASTFYRRTVIQLDPTQDRPAFSFFDLTGRTLIKGVWLGCASATLLSGLQGAGSVVGPDRAGVIRSKITGTWISCCAPSGALVWRRMDDLVLNQRPDEVGAVYYHFRLEAEAEDGTRSAPFETPLEPTLRRPYAAQSWVLDRDAAALEALVVRRPMKRRI